MKPLEPWTVCHEDYTPLVSIITPVYNGERTIGRAIDSVINQTLSEWELIVVNDGSTDGSNDLVSAIASSEPRIQFKDLQNNSGIAYARNVGLDMARGKFIAFLDCDDYLTTDSLELRTNFMQQRNIIISHGDYIRRYSGNRAYLVRTPEKVTRRCMYLKNKIPNLTGMIEASAAKELRQKSVGHEDYVFWFEALKNGRASVRCSAKPLAVYDAQVDGVSSNTLRSVRWHWQNLHRDFGFSGFLASVFTLCYILSVVSQRLSWKAFRLFDGDD